MTELDSLRKLSSTLLYEGCMLYPYRASALKNQRPGWTFGALLPPAYVARNPGESDVMQSQVLANISDPTSVHLEIRFLQLAELADAMGPAVERCINFSADASALLRKASMKAFAFPTSHSATEKIEGMAELGAERVAEYTLRLTVRVRNVSAVPRAALETRDAALNFSLLSVNALLTLSEGEFHSLLDPPGELCSRTAECKQIGVYPVLAGDSTKRSTMLISPIILYDFPQVAPESKGDFFDSSEIDEMLALRVLTLSDSERAEIQDGGKSAGDILNRTTDLSPAEMRKMHGTFRSDANPEGQR